MRQFKYVRGKQASTRKEALEMGKVPSVLLDNFSTLTGFKPRLDLLEATPGDPPKMTEKSDYGIKPGKDTEKPDNAELAGKSDYKNIDGPNKEVVPHENEKVKQGGVSVESQIKQANQEFAQRYAKANRLYDIKNAAGVEISTSKEDFVVKTANMETSETLDKLLAENESMYDRVKQSSLSPTNTKIPTNFSGLRTKKSSFNDDLEMVIAAGEDYS